jgi:hypothetical protein
MDNNGQQGGGMKKGDCGGYLVIALASCAAGGLIVGCADNFDQNPDRWSDWENLSLNAMIEEYGVPTRIETRRVVWEQKGPWKQISVWDELGWNQSLAAYNNLEETISYLVPEDKRKALEDFSKGIIVSANGSELSSQSFSEKRNFLALNLADEIIRNVRNPEDAKSFYALTIKLADAGRTSPYMKGLRFLPPPLPEMP